MRRVLTVAGLALALAPASVAGTPATGVTAVARGQGLFEANCSRCHGSIGEGIRNQGPPMRGVGAIAADFYLRTGYMPLANPHQQPTRSRVLFSEQQLRALVGFVASLGPGPAIPTPQWRTASVPAGQKLFSDHCAGCHQIVARGGVVTGARVPELSRATPRQIAEAVRVGPYLMPRFSPKAITPTQLNDIVAYVRYTDHADNPGGWSLGDLGPWPEGLVSWLLGGSILVALCMVFGRRARS